MGKAKNKYGRGGFSLIELLVYIAIMGFIIIVAGRAFSDSTGMRLRSQNMLSSAEEAGRVSAILKEDISQMGAGTGLSSSYTLAKGAKHDVLTFRKAHYSEDGVCQAVMEIEWSVRDKDSVLIRRCATPPPGTMAPNDCDALDDNAKLRECPPEVEMARNVSTLRFLPSKPGVLTVAANSAAGMDTLFPASPASSVNLVKKGTSPATAFISEATGKITLSGFEQNSSSSGTLHVNFYFAEPEKTDCKQIFFKAGEEYAMSFEMPCALSACKKDNNEKFNPMIMFQVGIDHLSVGLRDVTSGESISSIPDFLFYPPQDIDAVKIRHFEFSVPRDITACLGITAAFYSQAAAGRLEIEKFKVYRKTDHVYHFDKTDLDYNPNATTESGSASVKAFEMTLRINKNGEVNHLITVIPLPNNGIGGN